MSGHTEGPWRWYGNTDTRRLYLASPKNGRQIVMDFVRYGTQGAKPRFPANGVMVDADEMVRYEVAPDATSRDDERVYRADISGIDHPNARILEASVDLYEAAWKLLRAYAKQAEWLGSDVEDAVKVIERAAMKARYGS